MELFLFHAFSGQTLPRKSINGYYKHIVKYLKENMHRNITLSEVADELNMSVSNVKKIFSKYSGMSVMAYFNRCKIEQAILMLKAGDSVKEVAEKLGYSSQSAFYNSFKNITGVSPSKFKE